MDLVCPKCFQDTDLEVQSGVVCKHCNEDISGFKFRKPIISSTTAFIFGVGGFFAFDNYVLSEDRYPVAIEYEIIELCTSSYKKPMKIKNFKEKKSACICALEETMKIISYSDINKDESEFMKEFEKNASECRPITTSRQRPA